MDEQKKRRSVTGVADSVEFHKMTKAEKIARSVFKEDISTVKDHIVKDAILPRLSDFVKDTVMFMVTEFVSSWLYGVNSDQARRNVISSYGNKGYYDYSRSSNMTKEERIKAQKYAMKERLDYANIILNSHKEMIDVIEGMEKQIEHEGNVSVAELYSLCKKTGANQTDASIGWVSLEGWSWQPTSDGRFKLHLPKPIYI